MSSCPQLPCVIDFEWYVFRINVPRDCSSEVCYDIAVPETEINLVSGEFLGETRLRFALLG